MLKKYTNRDKLSYLSLYIFLLFWGNERRQKPNIPHLRHITLPPGFLDNCKDILTMKAEALETPKNRVVQLSMDEVGTFFSICTMGWKDFLIIKVIFQQEIKKGMKLKWESRNHFIQLFEGRKIHVKNTFERKVSTCRELCSWPLYS